MRGRKRTNIQNFYEWPGEDKLFQASLFLDKVVRYINEWGILSHITVTSDLQIIWLLISKYVLLNGGLGLWCLMPLSS